MARYHGVVGYGIPKEDPEGSGNWINEIKEFPYFGDVIRNTRNLVEDADKVNSNITVGNSISIVADPYALEHYIRIIYAEWEGALWTVTTVEVRRPRLILGIGDIYNGPTAPPPPEEP